MRKENQQSPGRSINTFEGDRKGSGIMNLKKISFIWLGILLCLLLLMVGCSSKSSEDRSNESAVIDQVAGGESTSVSESSAVFDASKIIYTGRIGLNTNQYQETFDQIVNYAEESGGFIQESGSNFISQDRQANSGYLTIRIPADRFSEAMEKIQSFGSPISADVSSSNISQQYQDVESQLNNLRIQEQRLLELLREATNMTDVLAIESELNRIRTEIDQLTSTKKNWDIEINYATIYVSLYEKEISSTSLTSPFSEIFNKIGEAFVTSVNLLLRLIAFLIVLLFSLLPFAAIALLGVYIFMRIRKKIKEKKGQTKKDLEGKEDEPPLK